MVKQQAGKKGRQKQLEESRGSFTEGEFVPDSNWAENDSFGPIEDISEVPLFSLFSVTISDICLHMAIFNCSPA
jgi:hypothetical protein